MLIPIKPVTQTRFLTTLTVLANCSCSPLLLAAAISRIALVPRPKFENPYIKSSAELNNPLITLPALLPDEQNAYHLFPIIVKGKENRDRLHDYLEQNGVGTVCHYPIAPHKQECYAKEAWNTPQLSLPITERLADEELSLPIGPAITLEEVAEVVRLVNLFE